MLLQTDDGSILHFYRRLLQLRKETPALHGGTLALDQFALLTGSHELLAWARCDGTETWFTYVNPTDAAQWVGGAMQGATIVFATEPALEGTDIPENLPPRMAFIARRDGTM